MKTISKEQFLDLIKYNNYIGVSNNILIENQASTFVKNIELDIRHSFAIIVGTGINGAIGLAIARHLLSYKKNISIFVLKINDKISKEFNKQLEILKNLNVKINHLETLDELSNFPECIKDYNTIIDSILGIEYDENYIEGLEYTIDCINKSRRFIMSVDMPSGLYYDIETRKIEPVYADVIITYHAMKETLINKNNLYNTKIIIENIGLLERE